MIKQEIRAQACVSSLAEEAIMAGCEGWEDLSESQQLSLAAALMCAKSQNGARFEYVTAVSLAKLLFLLIDRVMKGRSDPERFSNLGGDRVITMLGYVVCAGQEALDQARERLAARQVGLSEEEWRKCRERVRDRAVEF